MFSVAMFIVFVLLIFGTITDIRWREVPDWITYSTFSTGLALASLTSILEWTLTPLLHSIAGGVIAIIVGLALFYSGQWGGGDAKALIAMGAVLGIEASWNHVFPTFLINLIIVGGLYGLLWTAYIAVKERTKMLKETKKIFSRKRVLIPQIAIIIGGLAIITLSIVHLPLSFIIPGIVLGISLPTLYLLLVTFKAVEQCCLVKNIPIERVTEGDWVAKNIRVKGTLIYDKEQQGISVRQLNKLKKSKVTHLPIKMGMPFIPAFLVAYTIAELGGNIFFWLL